MVTTSVGIAFALADGDTARPPTPASLPPCGGDGGQRMLLRTEYDKALQRWRMVEHELRLAPTRN
jgi:hypothetical protein